MSSQNATGFVWQSPTGDLRAPQSGLPIASHVAASDYSATSFTLGVNLTDSTTYQVGLYASDWGSRGQAMKISSDPFSLSGSIRRNHYGY